MSNKLIAALAVMIPLAAGTARADDGTGPLRALLVMVCIDARGEEVPACLKRQLEIVIPACKGMGLTEGAMVDCAIAALKQHEADRIAPAMRDVEKSMGELR